MVRVLFDAAFLEPERADSAVLGAYFAAHELAHALIGRLRHATGMRAGDPGPR